MKEDSSDNNEKSATGVSIWKTHFREAVHQLSKGESDSHDKCHDQVLQNRLPWVCNLVDVDHFQQKVHK